MNNTLIFNLREKLDDLIGNRKLRDKFVVLFGMNTPGDEVINYLAQRGIYVSAVIDNNEMNRGKKLAGVSVYLPGEILEKVREDAIILICSRYFYEMKSQLEIMGYSSNQIVKVLEMSGDIQYSLEDETVKRNLDNLKEAYEYYKEIKIKYGNDVCIYVAPVKANGDVYLISSMLKAYIDNYKDEKILLAVIGDVCKRIAGMFGLRNVIVITQDEMEMLVKLSSFMGYDLSKIRIVQPYYMYAQILNKIEGYKDITFADMFYYGYFSKYISHNNYSPEKVTRVVDIEKRTEKLGIEKGKTIILSPYANSLPQIQWSVWKEIADKLQREGYKIFTNSASDSEVEVPGTEKIFFPIEDTVSILEYAGGFIAMRNGLCEVASSSNCKQVIIYPDKAGKFGKIKNVYGIGAMGLNNAAIELEDSDSLIEEVLEVFR